MRREPYGPAEGPKEDPIPVDPRRTVIRIRTVMARIAQPVRALRKQLLPTWHINLKFPIRLHGPYRRTQQACAESVPSLLRTGGAVSVLESC